MRHECCIKAEAFYAEFAFDVSLPDEWADLVVTVGQPQSPKPIAKSTPRYIERKDILRLANYLDDHLELITHNPDAQSDIYVPLELNFQLQALEGDVLDGFEGSIGLRVMANIADPGDQGGSLYIGCEGTVEVSEVRQFSTKLREFASMLVLSKQEL
jgi:hypothetical protein